MSGAYVDRLCRDWLRVNYGDAMASQYTVYSLLMPMWNSPDLNNALEKLKRDLGFFFGLERTFADTDYHEARLKLGLSDERTPVPQIFLKAMAKA